MPVTALSAVYAAVFLFALLLAYWRTLWVGKKYRVPVAVCSALNSGSLVAIILSARAVWQTHSYQTFGLLTAAAAIYLLTEWWSLSLKRQQEKDSAADRRNRIAASVSHTSYSREADKQ